MLANATPIAARPARARTLDAQAFSPEAGAGDDGSGADSTDALQAFLSELSLGNYTHARIPPGRYRLTRSLSAVSPSIGDLVLEATGTEFVFDIPKPERNRAYLRISNSARLGGRLTLVGLTTRLARPAIRVGGSDMIRLSGFREYNVAGIAIPSADNMGLTIGRGDPMGWTPDRIIVESCIFGGRRESRLHSHGSIGDTAVWIVSPAIETRVTGCRISETGDDAIYVGHSNTKAVLRVEIRENTLADIGVGIGISVPGAEVVGNRIDRTNVCAIRCERQNDNQASGAIIEGNVICRAGQLEAGDIGEHIIPKTHPHAIFVHEPVGRVTVSNNQIKGTRGCALVVLSHNDGPTESLYVEGGQYDRIGIDRNGTPLAHGRSAVFRRAGFVPNEIRNFIARGVSVRGSNHPLLDWTVSGFHADGPISMLDAQLIGCDLGNQPIIKLTSRFGAGLEPVHVSYSKENSKITKAVETSYFLQDPDLNVAEKT